MARRARRLSKEKARKRKSSTKRGYDRQWRNVRLIKLQADPLCEDCIDDDRSTEATEVHHIVKIKDDPELRLDLDNLMSLCSRCHSIRSARGE